MDAYKINMGWTISEVAKGISFSIIIFSVIIIYQMCLYNFPIVPQAIFNTFILIGMIGWDWKRIIKDGNLFAQKCAEHTTSVSMYVYPSQLSRITSALTLQHISISCSSLLSWFLFLEQTYFTNILQFSSTVNSVCRIFSPNCQFIHGNGKVSIRCTFCYIAMQRSASYNLLKVILCVSFCNISSYTLINFVTA